MAYIELEDYNNIGKDALDVVQQSNEQNRLLAEQYAMDFAAGYLRGRYDLTKAFALTGDERNMALVGCLTDISLYRMCLNLPARMGLEKRKQQFDEAVKWLQSVQNSSIMLDLPLVTGPNGEADYHNPIRTGEGIKNEYFW